MKKILIIRFSSIGDIVLTTSLIRCVKKQTNAEIHYLTKTKYATIIDSSPYIDKVITFQTNLSETLQKLHHEKYSFIIDLHNNFRSFWIRYNLRTPSSTLKKENFKKILLIYFGLDFFHTHVVDRYFNAIKRLHIINDNDGLDYFIPKNTSIDFDVNQNFITWCIGASYDQKALSAEQVVSVCDQLSATIVLLGGDQEKEKGKYIMQESSNPNIYNFCGKLSLNQSAYLIKHGNLVLTNDTGLMHVASALSKPIISFWGCTKPSLGFYPYMTKNQCVQIIAKPTHRPCSKHGRSCRIQPEGCIKQIDSTTIIEEISKFYKF